MRPTRLVKGLVSMLAADMGQGIYIVKQNHEASELLHLLGITCDRRTVRYEDIQKLVGISKTPATIAKYDRTYRRLIDFMKYKYNISDISLKEINHMFITDFETYLRSESGCNENTTAKFMQFFRRIIIIAKNNGWIFADPFANYTIRLKRVDRGYLTEKEVEKIIKKKFATDRLNNVRDIFIFSCFTGLACRY